MPDVVHLDNANLIAVADAAERSFEVAGLNRTSCPCGENQLDVRPCRVHRTLVSSLAVGLMLDCFAGEVKERQGTLAGVGLDWCEEDLTVNALELLADGDLPVIEIDVFPVEAEDFA